VVVDSGSDDDGGGGSGSERRKHFHEREGRRDISMSWKEEGSIPFPLLS
jgi:hypothetical protein